MEFLSFDNEKIWYKIWEAPRPRAVIQIMPGLAEVADYYEDFAADMNAAGFAVAMHEYRKHGRNRAPYGAGNLFRNYARDGSILSGLLRESYPGLPVALLAHSLGTSLSQLALYEKLARWDAIIFTGASRSIIDLSKKEQLLSVTDRAILLHGADSVNVMIFPLVFGRFNAPFAADRSSLGFITSDPERRRWLSELPYESPEYTNRFFRDLIIMQTDLADRENLESMQPPLAGTPILLLTGSEDITAAYGSYGDAKAELLRDAGYTDVTSIVYPGLRHSILQETERGKVTVDILNWLEQRLA